MIPQYSLRDVDGRLHVETASPDKERPVVAIVTRCIGKTADILAHFGVDSIDKLYVVPAWGNHVDIKVSDTVRNPRKYVLGGVLGDEVVRCEVPAIKPKRVKDVEWSFGNWNNGFGTRYCGLTGKRID